MRKLLVTEQVLDLFARKRVFTRPVSGSRLTPGDVLGFLDDMRLEPYSHVFAGSSLPAFLGAFSYSHSPLAPSASVGRYTSIGSGVAWMGPSHPVEWVSTSSVWLAGDALQGMAAYRADSAGRRDIAEPLPFDLGSMRYEIGNDVWIGDGVMIAPGVKIGDGAIVGARSLVLKDVEPYAIVGGNPARLIRWRFDAELIASLRRLAWWRFSPADIGDLDLRAPETFVDSLDARLSTLTPMSPFWLTAADLMALQNATARDGGR